MTRFFRYAIIGALAFGVDYGTLALLAPRLPLLAANTIAFVVANATNFLLAHGWVFGQTLRGDGVRKQYVAVLAISVVGLALNDAIVAVGIDGLGLPMLATKMAATGLVMLWNYGARVRWVY